MKEQQFIHSLRQLATMHQRTKKNFNAPVSTLRSTYANTLIEGGMSPEEAYEIVDKLTAREYPYFPNVNDIPF